ncbi:LptF/LptG family permease, partial [bacterium]|nr:LptF/LptG family permease [bacterium]
MKILSRYLLRELVPGFFLGLVIFSFLLLADHIFKINDLIIVKKLAPLTAARLFFYQFPFVL